MPAPDTSSGDVFTYTVNATIPPFEGTAYAFIWVKDAAGNISRTPGFDVVSFIPATPININRNDVRLFRILTRAESAHHLDLADRRSAMWMCRCSTT